MSGLLPDRRAARRQVLLSADAALSRLEHLWVEVAGGPRRRRYARHVEDGSGRTSREHLVQMGIAKEVWPRVQDALDGGVPKDEVIAGVEKVTTEAGEVLARELKRRAPQMLRDHRAIQRGMHRRMRALWGPAFDTLYEVYVCVEELGSDMQQIHGSTADPLITALLGLHARACLVLAEVHSLMVQGFPLGAWARTRTLYETAVIAEVLSEHGRGAGTADLAERFLLHAVVDEARDLELAVRAGVVVDQAEVAEVRGRRDAAVVRFGPMFAKDYGWARPLFPSLGPKGRVTFRDLEAMANSGLDRRDYRLGSHHVHSSAWAVVLNQVPRAGRVYRLTGSTNVAFGEPASVALAAALISTSSLVFGVEEMPEPLHLVGLRALQQLALAAMKLFAEGEVLVDGREARLQARLARHR